MAGIKSKTSCTKLLNEYLFFLWDGMGFFGFDDNKLDRLEGKKPRWYDPFFNKRWMFSNLILLAIIGYIIYENFLKLGDTKSQTLSKEENPDYTFDVEKQMTVIGLIGFNL